MNNNFTLSHRGQEPERGILYLVGTPIGNLSDISLRAINILKNVNLIACEDTRQTKKLMSSLKISNKLISFNQHNSQKKIPIIIDYLKSGFSIALVSDAGLPSICDPGEEIVKNLKLKGLETICIPGPSAALTALTTSGFQCSKFIFEGFLPKKVSEREKIISQISKNEKTTILYESPHRFQKLLNELKKFCGGERPIFIARELTKKFEEHIGENINDVIDYFQGKDVLGEFTIVIKGENKKTKNVDYSEFEIKKDLNDLINAGLSLSQASKYLAKKNNISKSIIYNMY